VSGRTGRPLPARCDRWNTPTQPGATACGTSEKHSDALTKTKTEASDSSMLTDPREPPLLLTADETAALLRTTRKAIYIMVERRQLPGVIRVGRRLLVRRDDLLHWLRQKAAPSLKE
jgi:excisionase family DNA binding protein